MDSYIPKPKREIDKPFLMPVEDVFSITGRGTVGTGRVERGMVKMGEEVEIVGIRDTQKTVVTGVEMFRKHSGRGGGGDNVGLLLRGSGEGRPGARDGGGAPKSVTPHTKFKGKVYILTKEEGGRHTPFFNGYRPQFYFRTTDVTGVATLPEGRGDGDAGRQRGAWTIELITPIAMEEELAVRDPRRRPHRRRRRRGRDHRVAATRKGREEHA